MGLEYAPLCRVCGKRKTKNANQVCSQCAKLTCTIACSICGNMGRRLYKGICSSCRNASHAQDMACYLPDAIADVRKTLVVLEHLDNGESYAEAGAAAGDAILSDGRKSNKCTLGHCGREAADRAERGSLA